MVSSRAALPRSPAPLGIRRRRPSAIRRTTGEIIFDVLNVVFLLLVAFITLYPFWYILILSLNEGRDSAQGGSGSGRGR